MAQSREQCFLYQCKLIPDFFFLNIRRNQSSVAHRIMVLLEIIQSKLILLIFGRVIKAWGGGGYLNSGWKSQDTHPLYETLQRIFAVEENGRQ